MTPERAYVPRRSGRKLDLPKPDGPAWRACVDAALAVVSPAGFAARPEAER